MKNYIVLTSIFPPSEAIQKYADTANCHLVVVGDKKTPADWHQSKATYLSPKAQVKTFPTFAELLPWNMYSRKNLGYLYAIKSGSAMIIDTDDDNIPTSHWQKADDWSGTYDTVKNVPYYNVYADFTSHHIWPRGFPLKHILDNPSRVECQTKCQVGIWQGLADGDPDVDAIYRLIDNTPIHFSQRLPIVLAKGTICPFNSQNTLFRKETFPLLYLPSFVTFRFTDILRGIIAQPILWAAGYSLGFHAADVVQQRNEHDYLKDFESELPCYLQVEEVAEIAIKQAKPSRSISQNLLHIYSSLCDAKIVPEKELQLVTAWINEMEKL